jgi:hypothetical protein
LERSNALLAPVLKPSLGTTVIENAGDFAKARSDSRKFRSRATESRPGRSRADRWAVGVDRGEGLFRGQRIPARCRVISHITAGCIRVQPFLAFVPVLPARSAGVTALQNMELVRRFVTARRERTSGIIDPSQNNGGLEKPTFFR